MFFGQNERLQYSMLNIELDMERRAAQRKDSTVIQFLLGVSMQPA